MPDASYAAGGNPKITRAIACARSITRAASIQAITSACVIIATGLPFKKNASHSHGAHPFIEFAPYAAVAILPEVAAVAAYPQSGVRQAGDDVGHRGDST